MARRRAWERTKSAPLAVSGRPSVAQQAVHVSTGSGQTPPERTLQGEQQDVLNRLGAVALGPDHVARQLKSPPAQDGGRALQLGPIVQGLGPDALRSRQRPRLGVVEQDGFDHRLPQPSPLAVGQRFRLEDGSDRTKGRPGESPAPPEVFLHVGHQTAEVGEPLAACELGRLPVCAAARQVRWDVGRHSQHLCMLRWRTPIPMRWRTCLTGWIWCPRTPSSASPLPAWSPLRAAREGGGTHAGGMPRGDWRNSIMR
uniref:Uncharacterized protein n=1 Tax=Macrostomum lignano TaxID=282301 RepID=A0A1I8HKC7_9PLAT